MRTSKWITWIGLLILAAGCSSDNPTTSDPRGRSLSAVTLADGVSLVTGGVGLYSQPASFSVQIPVANASDIVQATFYWSGRANGSPSDPTIVINGTEHTGTLIGTRNAGYGPAYFYKLDGLALVSPGSNSFTVEGFDFGPNDLTDGIGLAVIYNDPASDCTEIQILEPTEFLYFEWTEHPQGDVFSFSFPASDQERTGRLVVFVGDAEPNRSDRIWWTAGDGSPPGNLIGGPYEFFENQLYGALGSEWDIFEASNLAVPAGATYFAYQLNSPPEGNGDSMMHVFAAFCVSGEEPPPPEGCFRTIGFWKHQFNVATGDRHGFQHIDNEGLTELLADVVANTDVDYDGGDGVITFREADNYLDLGNATMCQRAHQQFLATLLNFAWNGLDGSIMVDTDYDDIPDTELGDAIEEIEDHILEGHCQAAKNMADSINNMGGCPDED